jgi:hypothetical protein
MTRLRRYEIFLPLRFNDGRPVPAELGAEVLLKASDGVNGPSKLVVS